MTVGSTEGRLQPKRPRCRFLRSCPFCLFLMTDSLDVFVEVQIQPTST
jgi:hypothetical protein